MRHSQPLRGISQLVTTNLFAYDGSKAATSVNCAAQARTPKRRTIYTSSFLRSSDEQEKKIKRPDLKKSASRFGPTKIVSLACLLMIAYMYPMIFKPLFGIGEAGGDPSQRLEDLKASGLDPSKTRPANMPEWTSPFGPRSSEK